MKKLFSVFFSIAFLLVFVSLFSSKFLASASTLGTCEELGGYCHDPDDTTACPVGDIANTSGCNSGVCCKLTSCGTNNTGSCQASSNYCTPPDPSGLHGPYYPAGDAYCNASTLGGHPFCCAEGGGGGGSTGGGTWRNYCTGADDANGNKWQIWKTDDKGGFQFVENGTAANNCAPALPTCGTALHTCGSGNLVGSIDADNKWYCWDTQGHVIGCVVPPPATTATPVPSSTLLSLTIGLDGIGTTGDQVNSDYATKNVAATKFSQASTAGSNQNPKNPTRPVTLTLIDSANSSTPIKGNVTFQPADPNKGKYTGTVPYGTTVKAGTYTVKITMDSHLIKLAGTVTIADTNTSVTVPKVDLVAGDIDGNNTLDGTDYTILLSCLSDQDYKEQDHTLCNQNASYKAKSDLEDNGVVDKFDYNLFLREFSKKQTGD